MLGLLFHDLYELNSRQALILDDYSSLQGIFANFTHKHRIKFDFSLYPPLETWQEVRRMFSRLFDEQGNGKGKSVSAFMPEIDLISKDKVLKGKPDLIIRTGNDFSIVEYKSGSIYESDGSLKVVYVDQLQFYSYLVSQNFESYPVRLILNSLVDGIVEVMLDIPRGEYLADAFREEIKQIDQILNDENLNLSEKILSLATPSIESCKYCDLRPFCSKAPLPVVSDEFEFSLLGVIEGVELVDKHFYGKLLIRIEESTKTIINVPRPELASISVGSIVTIINLRSLPSGHFEFGTSTKVGLYE